MSERVPPLILRLVTWQRTSFSEPLVCSGISVLSSTFIHSLLSARWRVRTVLWPKMRSNRADRAALRSGEGWRRQAFNPCRGESHAPRRCRTGRLRWRSARDRDGPSRPRRRDGRGVRCRPPDRQTNESLRLISRPLRAREADDGGKDEDCGRLAAWAGLDLGDDIAGEALRCPALARISHQTKCIGAANQRK